MTQLLTRSINCVSIDVSTLYNEHLAYNMGCVSNSDMSQTDMAVLFEYCQSVISISLKRDQIRESLSLKYTCGHPRSISKWTDNCMVSLVAKNPNITSQEIKKVRCSHKY